MISRFELAIHTAHGSITSSVDANDAEQIAANMPPAVISYTVYSERDRPGVARVDDMDLWLSLDRAARRLEHAANPAHEVIADADEMFHGLAFEFDADPA